jgi:peroxiredoxin
MTQVSGQVLRRGDRAPDFRLAAVQTDTTVTLDDYRSRSCLLLALFRGLYCPFCRRAIVQLASSAARLKPLGIESLAVVATELENARLYYRFRPIDLPLAVDPDLQTHRSYGVPRMNPTPEFMATMASVRVNPLGALPAPLPVPEASLVLDRLEGYQQTETDRRDDEKQFPLLTGQFLIDRHGVIRWMNIECQREGPEGLGSFPTQEELLAAAAAVS